MLCCVTPANSVALAFRRALWSQHRQEQWLLEHPFLRLCTCYGHVEGNQDVHKGKAQGRTEQKTPITETQRCILEENRNQKPKFSVRHKILMNSCFPRYFSASRHTFCSVWHPPHSSPGWHRLSFTWGTAPDVPTSCPQPWAAAPLHFLTMPSPAKPPWRTGCDRFQPWWPEHKDWCQLKAR